MSKIHSNYPPLKSAIQQRYAKKPVNPKYYGTIQVNPLIEYILTDELRDLLFKFITEFKWDTFVSIEYEKEMRKQISDILFINQYDEDQKFELNRIRRQYIRQLKKYKNEVTINRFKVQNGTTYIYRGKEFLKPGYVNVSYIPTSPPPTIIVGAPTISI